MADMGYSFAAAPSSVPVPVRSVKEVHIVTKSKLLQDHEKQEKLRASIPATQGTLSLGNENGDTINAWAAPQVEAAEVEEVADLAQENPAWIEDDPSARFDRLPQPFRRVASIVEGLLTNVYHQVDHNAQLRATDPVYLSTQAEEKLEPTTASEIIPLEDFHVGAVCGVHRRDQFTTMLGCSDGGVRMLRQGMAKEALVWSGVPAPGEGEEEGKGPSVTAQADGKEKDKGKAKGKDKGKGKGDKKKGKAEKDSKKPVDPEPITTTDQEAGNEPSMGTDATNTSKHAIKCITAVPTATMDIICAVWIRHQVIVIRLDSGGDCHVQQKIDVSGEEVASLKFSTNALYLLIAYSTSDTIEVYLARPKSPTDAGAKTPDPAANDSANIWDNAGSDVPSHRTPLFTIPRPPSSQEIDAQLAADAVEVADLDDQSNAKNAKGGKGGKGGKQATGGKNAPGGGKGGKGGKKEVAKRGGGGGAKAPKGSVVTPDEGSAGDITARSEQVVPAVPHTGQIALLHDGAVVISWQGLLDVRTYTLPNAEAIAAIPPPVPSTAQDAEGVHTLPVLLADGHFLLPATPTCNAVDYDMRQVAFGLANGGAAVLDTVNKRMSRSVGQCLNSSITAITFDRSGTIALGSQQGSVAFTGVQKSGEDDPKRASNKTPAACTLYLVPVATGHVLSVAADASARVLDVRDGSALRVLPFKSVHDSRAGPLLCTSDGGGSLVVVVHHHDGSASLQIFDTLQSHTELILDFGGGPSSVQYAIPGRDSGGNGPCFRRPSAASSVAPSLNIQSALSRAPPTPAWAGPLARGSSGSQGPPRSRPFTLTPNASRTRHVRVAEGNTTSLSHQVSQVVPRSQLSPGATPMERARAGVRDVVQDRASRTMRVQMRRNVLKEIAAER